MYFLWKIEEEIQSLLKFFLCVKFSRGLIFANYQIPNFSRGFLFTNFTFRNISCGLNFANFDEFWPNSRKPRNLIHAKINPLKVLQRSEIHSLLPEKKCRVNYNRPNVLIFSWNKVWVLPSSLSNYFLSSFWLGYRSKILSLAHALPSHFNERSQYELL